VFERHTAPPTCRVALELASLEALAAGDLATAYVWAHRAHERFGSAPGSEACVADAARVLETLSEFRPSSERLSPGGAVPAALADRSVAEAAVADFVRRKGAARAKVTLEEVAVYGADAAFERPLSKREVRVVLRFDGPAVYRRRELAATADLPRRLALDLDDVALSPRVLTAITVASGGLQRIRSFPLSEGRMRVSFDVEDETAYRLFFLDAPYRVVMDFRDGSSTRVRGRGPVVVLDTGHGGEQPGAKGPDGLKESVVALSLARRVRASIKRRRPDVFVVLTRDEDRFLMLEERTAIANGYDADLFVSIHLNASSSAEDKGGVSTFVLDTTDDQAALRLAARENGTDERGVTELQFILASLYREDQVDHSLDLARLVQRATLASGRSILPQLNDRGVKRALFYVLVGATMPAILVEASFITRPEEAAALLTDGYRDALAEGMAEGIERYLAHEGRR
jgi:N-acetylmuramoyl-L-alanine amidase